jgi:hypothetical protein
VGDLDRARPPAVHDPGAFQTVSSGQEPDISALGRFVSVRRTAGALAAVTAGVMIVGFSPVISAARAASNQFVARSAST